MFVKIFDDFSIIYFIFHKELIDFQQLPVLRTIILNIVVWRGTFLYFVDLFYP